MIWSNSFPILVQKWVFVFLQPLVILSFCVGGMWSKLSTAWEGSQPPPSPLARRDPNLNLFMHTPKWMTFYSFGPHFVFATNHTIPPSPPRNSLPYDEALWRSLVCLKKAGVVGWPVMPRLMQQMILWNPSSRCEVQLLGKPAGNVDVVDSDVDRRMWKVQKWIPERWCLWDMAILSIYVRFFGV